MRFLIDTNIFISVEPTGPDDMEERSPGAAHLLGRLATNGCTVYLHPYSSREIGNDSDESRRRIRELLFKKYAALASPPAVTSAITSLLGTPSRDSHDWVDLHLLAALKSHAVDFLVTDDIGIIRKARRLGLTDTVVSVAEAHELLNHLFPAAPVPPPAVERVPVYSVDIADPIFDSLKLDYPKNADSRGFEEWFADCQRQGRECWVVQSDEGGLAAICIFKPEENPGYGMRGAAIKLCTFKVSESYSGRYLGELLLKTAFALAERTPCCWLYTTTFPPQERLISFLEDFGFFHLDTKENGELVMAKTTDAARHTSTSVSALNYHVLLGPPAARIADVPGYLVPIQPRYHRLLFPEMEAQQSLWNGTTPYGNSIRKAYLCNAQVRTIAAGHNLFFYRSQDDQAVTVHGVVEAVMVSSDAREVARFVGKRTVYPYADIVDLCATEVVAILFRQARRLRSPIGRQEMDKNGMVDSHPQSITTIPMEVSSWLATRISM